MRRGRQCSLTVRSSSATRTPATPSGATPRRRGRRPSQGRAQDRAPRRHTGARRERHRPPRRPRRFRGGAGFRTRTHRGMHRGCTRRDLLHLRRHGVGQLGAERRGVCEGTGQSDRVRRRASRSLRERATARKAGISSFGASRGRRRFRPSAKPCRCGG